MSGEEAAGRVLAGRYRLESELGRGGMGVVWRAVDTLIERTVALKELRPPPGPTGSDEAASFVERALREARNAGRLNHPSVVAVYDVIAPRDGDAVVYIVMEYVQAPTLAEVIDQHGRLPPARAATMGLGILDALTAAHAMGIVHRDIKPANVLVPPDDKIKLTDFGIALAADDSRLTRSGVMGTHAYLAPECFDGNQVGPATDLWALGATLFHTVAGRAPFARPTTTATLRAILFEDPPPPPCPPPLARVITGLLTRPVEQRLNADTARDLLEHAAASAPTADAPPTPHPGHAAWQSQATTHHPTTPPPPPPHGTAMPGQVAGQTTHPGTPPPPYRTTRPAHPGNPAADPTSGASWTGPPPPQRNSPPWLVVAVATAAAAVLLVVVLASSGGTGSNTDDPGDGGSAEPSSEHDGDVDVDASDGDIGIPVNVDDEGTDDGVVASGAGSAESAEAVARELIDAVNRGDDNTAVATLCPDSDAETEIAEAVTGAASVEIDPATIAAGGTGNFQATLVGTVDGESFTSGYISAYPTDDDTGWCVYAFYL